MLYNVSTTNYNTTTIFIVYKIVHFQEKELTYIKQQEKKLNALFHSTDTIENEIVHTENALEER